MKACLDHLQICTDGFMDRNDGGGQKYSEALKLERPNILNYHICRAADGRCSCHKKQNQTKGVEAFSFLPFSC